MRTFLEKANSRRPEARGQFGFTLLELTISFGIIGLLSVIGFSSFTSYSRRQVLDQSATQVRSAIEEARFNALSKIKPEFCDPAYPLQGYEFELCSGNPDCAGDYQVRAVCTLAPGHTSTRILSRTFPPSVDIIASDNPCTVVRYSVITGYQGNACEIPLSAYSNTRSVEVDAAGSVTVDDTVVGGAFFTPTPTFNPWASPTDIPVATATNTPTPTSVPAFTPTQTPTTTPSPTATMTPTSTMTPTPTVTPQPSCTTCKDQGYTHFCPGFPPFVSASCSNSSQFGMCTYCP